MDFLQQLFTAEFLLYAVPSRYQFRQFVEDCRGLPAAPFSGCVVLVAVQGQVPGDPAKEGG